MSDILDIAKFDASVQTTSGRSQFSMVDTAGELIGNREYKEGFDRFKSGCICGDSYVWRVLSAVADKTGLVLYDNVKNYIDYVTNIDVCKVQSLRSMVKMFGISYKVFERLDLLPPEILDLVNIFSINKKYVLYGDKILQEYRDRLSSESVIFDYNPPSPATGQDSVQFVDSVLDYRYPVGGNYYDFVVSSFIDVLSGFLNLTYEEGGSTPIYRESETDDYDTIYNELSRRRDKYMRQYEEGTVEYERRQYKICNGVPLGFDECAVLDKIEAGMDLEENYSGAELKLIQMEREYREKPVNRNKTSRFAYYKRQRVLEYANFVIDKYFSDHRTGLSTYQYDSSYFEVGFNKQDADTAGSIYENSGIKLVYPDDSGKMQLNYDMISSVAQSLADTSMYISSIRDKIKLQTRKNYMKGTYDLMLYVINEFLVDYSRLNPMFRDQSVLSIGDTSYKIADLLSVIYADLSSHDINNLTAIEYFDETEYYNISAATDSRSNMAGTNDRFWQDSSGEALMERDGIDRDFDIKSITSFYMDTLGMRDNYISDENSLGAFLDAVFNLGAMESFVHDVSVDINGVYSPHELFGAQVEKYGHYSDDLYAGYLGVKRAWATFMLYLSGENYEYQVSDSVQVQALSVADYIRQLILDRELSSVSVVYDAYIDKVDQLSSRIDQGVDQYNNLISGEYAFYFEKAADYKYCFEDFDDWDSYKHQWYVNSDWDTGLEYWYDMIQAVDEYARGRDEDGDYITNWPIRDTVSYFYQKFIEISSRYLTMIGGDMIPDLDLFERHNWSQEYGFVDISSVSLEDELKYGYDFIKDKIRERTEYITNMLNSLKQQAIQMQNLSQSIKNALTQAVASYDDKHESSNLGDSTVWCVSLNTYNNGYPSQGYKTYENSRCQRNENNPGATAFLFSVERQVGTKKFWYYCAKPDDDGNYKTGQYAFSEQSITPYSEDDDILTRCAAIKEYMGAPTSFTLVKQEEEGIDDDGRTITIKSYDEILHYDMMDEGIFASISQVEADYANLQNQVDGIINQLEKLGYEFQKAGDIDETITELIDFINTEVDEDAIGNDEKIQTYKQYLRAIIQLSSAYIPVKYEYDSIYRDQKQRAYLSEFQQDNDMTLAALDRLSSYSVDKDEDNKEAILGIISQMRQKYDEAVSEYQGIADDLVGEYMLPQGFQPYAGYIEEMVRMMYQALEEDVQEKIWRAHDIARRQYVEYISPAAAELIERLGKYSTSLYKLPDAVNRRLRELYYFDDPSYIRQKEIFLTYGGRHFCYYPYYNLKNVIHSSYQVHPFLWNFIRSDYAYDIVSKTFFSVNVDELEARNIVDNWRKFFGDYGESRYGDISKPRYPDYSGYQSRYENSNHVAGDTLFVSEVVDYDGAFYPPAVEWIRANGITKAISSVAYTKYNTKMASDICESIGRLRSLEWSSVSAYLAELDKYKPDRSVDKACSCVYDTCYKGRALSNITLQDVCNAVQQALSSDETFYGRFYRQLRLDREAQRETREYIVNQLSSYWGGGRDIPGGGPSIFSITEDATFDKVYDIYRYGMDSYGNMYCLYKQYDSEVAKRTAGRGGLSYRFKQSTPGWLWIRLKDHPLAFPAFSGSYPNVWMATDKMRHKAFSNLLGLSGAAKFPISASLANCIYDFEFTKSRADVTFVTKMRDSDLTCDSRSVQNYENSWLVHCKPRQEVVYSDDGLGRNVLYLYSPDDEVDYFKSGENWLFNPSLSDESSLDGAGVILYQYIGSYLKGDNSIYHAYVMKHVYKYGSGSLSSVERDVIDDIKICPVINGKYKQNNDIKGFLTEDSPLNIVGSDVCIAYDEVNGIVNFAAQTVLAADAAICSDNGEIGMLSNADGPVIDDNTDNDMNSHDVFDTNITIFRKQIVSRRLKNIRKHGSSRYTFNTNADMSYFPVYPGFAGAKKLYERPQYQHYNIELLGTAKDISQQISYVNPFPDPYLDADAILSNFTNARVYQDYLSSSIEGSFKTVDNKLIGQNSDVIKRETIPQDDLPQLVVWRNEVAIWQIRLDKLYNNFNVDRALKLKVLLFNKKCLGKNPYMFSDISALPSDDWVDLYYDTEERDIGKYSVISASDYVFGYSNRVIVQTTLDGIQETGVSDSNHIYNVKAVQARLVTNRTANAMTLEIRFVFDDASMNQYTYVPAGQLQLAFMDVRNLEVFNYFHYLDAYGVLHITDYLKTMEDLNEHLTRYGQGWTIYYAGHKFTEDELMTKLRSYYEYKDRMLPLSSVDLSQYDSLSDVYILQGDRRLQFKVDEEFRYELSHPGYFYPTVNSKFPLNPAQYAMQTMSFKENAAIDMMVGLFGQNNLFMLDTEDPASALSKIGRIDIPVIIEDTECVFAYEDYMDFADGSTLRNCDLYDVSDPRVLQFVQFEVDSPDANQGMPLWSVLEIPDEYITNKDMNAALAGIGSYMSSHGIFGVYPLFFESGRMIYSQEYMGFTLDDKSLDREQIEQLSRIYVNYRKYDDGGPKIELYFNYMNYLDSPYLRIVDNKTYIDTIDNTYLRLKQDENGMLDIVIQFRYYKGGNLYGYRNVKLASYQIYNISDDKPKFLMKKIMQLDRDGGSNAAVQPRVALLTPDLTLDAEASGGGSGRIEFDMAFSFETNMRLARLEFYVDYPSDFMEFRSSSGKGWTMDDSVAGYAKLTIDPGVESIAVPAHTVETQQGLISAGTQRVIVYTEKPTAVGENGIYADVFTGSAVITVLGRDETRQ